MSKRRDPVTPTDARRRPSRYREQYGVIVLCRDEPHQRKVYASLVRLGHRCRVVVT